jgi:nicotinate-nucleotide adenylyltransferase
VVSARPGWGLKQALIQQADIADVLEQHQTDDFSQLHQQPSGLIYLSEVEQLDISSTQIRDNVKTGVSNVGLLPEAVAKFIDECGLYR